MGLLVPAGIDNMLMTAPPLSPAAYNALAPLFGLVQSRPPWSFVAWLFQTLLSELHMTRPQYQSGIATQEELVATLNRAYYGHASKLLNGVLIGSWGKDTAVRPPRDIDLLYLLPGDVYWRFDQRLGNRSCSRTFGRCCRNGIRRPECGQMGRS